MVTAAGKTQPQLQLISLLGSGVPSTAFSGMIALAEMFLDGDIQLPYRTL